MMLGGAFAAGKGEERRDYGDTPDLAFCAGRRCIGVKVVDAQ
jgi:hypothetical protein